MKISIALFSTILIFTACQPEEVFLPKDPVHEYFKEITLGSEFTFNGKYIRKWKTDLHVFVSGNAQPELMEELEKIIVELNTLLEPIQIRITEDSLAANYFVFFGAGKTYVERFNSEARPFLAHNLGLFAVQWNDRCEIYKGSMYIDTERCKAIKEQKHLLREEFTQSLGLFNDSFEYSNSIFQEQWTNTTYFSEMDRQIITLLYKDAIRPCMGKAAVDSVLYLK